MINIAVMGYGTVGSGVVEVFSANREAVAKRAGQEIDVKYVLDLRDFPGDPIQEKIVHDFEVIVNDPEIGIVVEVMGGIEPACTFVRRCLEAGKSVVTSNKALVAKHGAELLAIAEKKKVRFLFEASVGGGIPIIRALETCLTADVVDEVKGILNGTTNYMLSKMFYEGADYDEVLKEAQERGYAERNPEADVEGHDACRKIAILSSIITGHQVDFEDIYTEGITKISSRDMLYAKKMGKTIKLLACSTIKDGHVEAIVAPVLIGTSHPLGSVNDVFNAVFVHGNMLGDAMFYGSGAGKLPTASAVAADVIDEVRRTRSDVPASWDGEKQCLLPHGETSRKFFVRIQGNIDDLQAKAEEAFGVIDVVKMEELEDEFAFITPVMTEENYAKTAARFPQIIHMIRVEE